MLQKCVTFYICNICRKITLTFFFLYLIRTYFSIIFVCYVFLMYILPGGAENPLGGWNAVLPKFYAAKNKMVLNFPDKEWPLKVMNGNVINNSKTNYVFLYSSISRVDFTKK